jgi:hypothetical protein
MNQAVNKEDLKTLLEPVELGSFALSSQTRSRENYSGFPEIKNSKMWDFSITENGDGNRILSFLVDNRTLNFQLQQSEQKNQPIAAKRLPDTEVDDFGVGGNSYTGRAQIHKSKDDSILGTFQTGKTNMTFQLQKDPENPQKWSIIPRKNPNATVQSFVKGVTEKYNTKKANQSTSVGDMMNKLTYPLTGGWGGALASAGIGFGLGGIKGLYDDWKHGKKNNQFSALQKALLGAGAGGLFSGALQYFGDPKYMTAAERYRHLNNMDPEKNLIFSERFYTAPSYADAMEWQKKDAFEGFRAELQTTPNNFSRAELKTTPSRLGAPHTQPTSSAPQSITYAVNENPKLIAARQAVQRAAQEREENARRLNELSQQKVQESQLVNSHKLTPQAEKPVMRSMSEKQIIDQNNKIKEQGIVKRSSQKLAFSSGNQTVDLIALQSILGADPTLTQGDRNVLMGQARAALRQAPGRSINVNQLRGMGLGMLIGYVGAKMAGFGTFGTVASVAAGGALGRMGRKSGPSWQPGGYWTY